jgi:quinol monooxygenase YgiN
MGITIIAKFSPKPGCEKALAEALAEAAPIYRKDPGTLGWHIMSGKKEATGSYVAIERYTNGAAIKTHAANPVSRLELLQYCCVCTCLWHPALQGLWR